MKNFSLVLAFFLVLFLNSVKLYSAGGFYIAKSDQKMFNRSTQMVIARDQNKTVLTILTDYRGELKEFALLIPVSENLQKNQIRILDHFPLNRLQSYSAPRSVRYFDEKVCPVNPEKEAREAKKAHREENLNPQKSKIKTGYAEGDYDISVLSIQENEEIENWLMENGYKIPKEMLSDLDNYQNKKVKFVWVKLSLKEKIESDFSYLRPIQIEFESSKFLVPIPLSTANGRSLQDIVIYALTRHGRVEMTNLHTAFLPTNLELPFYIEEDFGGFYQAMLMEQFKKKGKKTIFTEYAGNLNQKNPDAEKVLSIDELQKLGVFWIHSSQAKNVFLTRLHLYGEVDYFPDELRFRETSDQKEFYVDYAFHYPTKKIEKCPAAKEYRNKVAVRNEREAETLSELTGWPIENIRKVIKESSPRKKRWYQYVWGDQD